VIAEWRGFRQTIRCGMLCGINGVVRFSNVGARVTGFDERGPSDGAQRHNAGPEIIGEEGRRMYGRVKSRAKELALSRDHDADHEEDRCYHDRDDHAAARRSDRLTHTDENENAEYATCYFRAPPPRMSD